jgi:glycosyltransferase involved in cell wall biosynthesis
MSKLPLVSVIVAVFNGVNTLKRCIDSVLDQTYQDVEIIVMDGGSSDGSQKLLESYGNKISYWESKLDDGIADAWNKALTHVKGDWFLILGADDYLWNKEVFANVFEIQGVGNKLLVYGCVNNVSEKGIVDKNVGGEWSLSRFLAHPMYFSHQSVFCHTLLVDQIGGFNTSLRIAMDYDFLLRAIKVTTPYCMKNILISGFTVGGISGSCNNILTMFKEISGVKRKNGYNNLQIHYQFLILKAYVKYVIQKLLGDKYRGLLVNFYRKITKRTPV